MNIQQTIPLAVIQLNCNGSNAYQDTLFELALKQRVDLLLVQEPYLRPDLEPHSHGSFTTLRPDLSKEVRVAVRNDLKLRPNTNALTDCKTDNAIRILTATLPRGHPFRALNSEPR